MIEACDALAILRAKNIKNPQWINRDLYRLLYSPSLFVLAYERLKSKPGNMTPGADGKTLDGFGPADIEHDIALLRSEQYWPKPVRRTYIPKADGKRRRPLGIPSPRDKIIQECLRLILEAIYEPTFHENSHGFRPERSCHTALESLRRNWVGTKWVIELDITQCFERIDHHRLLDILRERIQDDRFVNLIRKFLNAGYLEDWKYHATFNGTPQGSVISPILTNIYLDRLDRALEAICKCHTQGIQRGPNPVCRHLLYRRQQLLAQVKQSQDPAQRRRLKQELLEVHRHLLNTSTLDCNDPTYTRAKFLRYADDIVVGIIGPKVLAEQVLEEIATEIEQDLKLELNRQKTRITHLATEQAHFLGYAFKTLPGRWQRRTRRRKNSPIKTVHLAKVGHGNIALLVPLKDLSPKLKKYMANGKPVSLPGLVNQSVDHILEHYNGVMRGWYNYYQLALNVCSLDYARYVLKYSLAKTLAKKEQSSVNKILRKYGKHITFLKPNGREIHFFDEPLKQVKRAQVTDASIDGLPTWWPRRRQTRLYNQCAICGSSHNIEMHHVRHIRKRGETVKGFTLYLVSINRKQIPVCHQCHRDIHNGQYDGANLAEIHARMQAAQQPRPRGPST